MRSGKLIIFVLLSLLLMVGGLSFADDEGSDGGTLKINKAEWDQAKQKLKVKATEGNGGQTLTAHYGGSEYQLQYKLDKKEYELKESQRIGGKESGQTTFSLGKQSNNRGLSPIG